VGVGIGAHQPSSGRVGVGVGPSETRTGSMVGVRPSKASTGGVMGATSRQPRTRRMPKPSSRMGSSVAGVGMLSSSYLAARRIRVIIVNISVSFLFRHETTAKTTMKTQRKRLGTYQANESQRHAPPTPERDAH
jgi:hypothetical protein